MNAPTNNNERKMSAINYIGHQFPNIVCLLIYVYPPSSPLPNSPLPPLPSHPPPPPQFTSWRDRGVPVEPGQLVQLVQLTR